jgi:hypothetical protein
MPAGMSAVITVEELTQSPAWFPLEALGRDAVRLVHLDEGAYRDASFLDQRLLSSSLTRTTLELALVEAAAAGLVPRLHYVFHTGHVGSTLISRLIGAHANFFSLREPALLRAAAERSPSGTVAPGAPPVTPPLRVTLSLLARTWRASQRAVVKVTSVASELADEILTHSEHPAAVFMFVEPLAYLRGILAGPNSRAESKVLAAARLKRLVRRLAAAEWHADPKSEGEQVAMSWLCEMLTLHQAALLHPAKVLWVNFDAFLAAPQPSLQAIFHALGAQAAQQEIAALVSGPIMRQYSKAPEHAYDAQLRREVLQSADWDHAAEIRRGLAWLEGVARQYPLAAAVLRALEARRVT